MADHISLMAHDENEILSADSALWENSQIMAAPVKDIVSMFDTEKHRASSDRAFEPLVQRFADEVQTEKTEIISEASNLYADEMLHDLLG